MWALVQCLWPEGWVAARVVQAGLRLLPRAGWAEGLRAAARTCRSCLWAGPWLQAHVPPLSGGGALHVDEPSSPLLLVCVRKISAWSRADRFRLPSFQNVWFQQGSGHGGVG